jgi:hypothetical protein
VTCATNEHAFPNTDFPDGGDPGPCDHHCAFVGVCNLSVGRIVRGCNVGAALPDDGAANRALPDPAFIQPTHAKRETLTMKKKDIATVIGSFCLAFGPQIVMKADSIAAWYVGTGLQTLGGVLIGARAFGNKEDNKPKE